MKNFLASLTAVILSLALVGCVSTSLPSSQSSPWEAIDINTKSNPLDLAFTNSQHGFLVGSNRLIMETNDAGSSWTEMALDLPEEENFRLISIDFSADEGWIVGQPGLLLHSENAGKSWSRLFLDTKLPGEPYMVTALGKNGAELATNVGAVYRTKDAGNSWQAQVEDAAGAVRDLRRSPDGNYISVSSLGNFFATWNQGEERWTPHQRESSQRLQAMGFQPNGNLWMLSRGAQLRFNENAGNPDEWGKPVVPITNGYGYLDMAWDQSGSIWAGGGSGTLLVSEDNGKTWRKDPVGEKQPTNFSKIIFFPDGKGFVMGERGSLLRWIG